MADETDCRLVLVAGLIVSAVQAKFPPRTGVWRALKEGNLYRWR